MIDTKYFKLTTGTSYFSDGPPKLFVDWFLHKGNPKYYSWNDTFYLSFGIFGLQCIVEFCFNFQEIEREMNDEQVNRIKNYKQQVQQHGQQQSQQQGQHIQQQGQHIQQQGQQQSQQGQQQSQQHIQQQSQQQEKNKWK